MFFFFETAWALGPSSFSFGLPFLLKSQDNLANSRDIHSSLHFLYFGILLHLIFFQQMPSYFKRMASLHDLTSIFSLASHYRFILLHTHILCLSQTMFNNVYGCWNFYSLSPWSRGELSCSYNSLHCRQRKCWHRDAGKRKASWSTLLEITPRQWKQTCWLRDNLIIPCYRKN